MWGDNDDDYDYHSGARIGKHYDDDDDGDPIPVFQFLYGCLLFHRCSIKIGPDQERGVDLPLLGLDEEAYR